MLFLKLLEIVGEGFLRKIRGENFFFLKTYRFRRQRSQKLSIDYSLSSKKTNSSVWCNTWSWFIFHAVCYLLRSRCPSFPTTKRLHKTSLTKNRTNYEWPVLTDRFLKIMKFQKYPSWSARYGTADYISSSLYKYLYQYVIIKNIWKKRKRTSYTVFTKEYDCSHVTHSLRNKEHRTNPVN